MTKTIVIATALVALAASCRSGGLPTTAGLDSSQIPKGEGDDYAVFARRCSKCHALSRPLDSGITSDAYWTLYVAKMRHLPGSGISEDDSAQILRFLYAWSAAEREKRKEADK